MLDPGHQHVEQEPGGNPQERIRIRGDAPEKPLVGQHGPQDLLVFAQDSQHAGAVRAGGQGLRQVEQIAVRELGKSSVHDG